MLKESCEIKTIEDLNNLCVEEFEEDLYNQIEDWKSKINEFLDYYKEKQISNCGGIEEYNKLIYIKFQNERLKELIKDYINFNHDNFEKIKELVSSKEKLNNIIKEHNEFIKPLMEMLFGNMYWTNFLQFQQNI